MPEVIDLCSTEDDDDEDDDDDNKNLVLSPIKPRISKHPKKKHRGYTFYSVLIWHTLCMLSIYIYTAFNIEKSIKKLKV